MYQYPKQIVTIAQQLQSYIDAGMEISMNQYCVYLLSRNDAVYSK